MIHHPAPINIPSPLYYSPPLGSPHTYYQTPLSPVSPPSPQPMTPASPLSPGSGYSLVSFEDAEWLISTLMCTKKGFKEKRQQYISQQKAIGGKEQADIMDKDECFEIAGEDAVFEELIEKLGVFDTKESVVMYKKVPRTSVQARLKQPQEQEQAEIASLFNRWMQVDKDTIHLVQQNSPNRKFKIWRSLKYINLHGSYCEMFVVSTMFNRHMFHTEHLY